jgi:hypothetical protein
MQYITSQREIFPGKPELNKIQFGLIYTWEGKSYNNKQSWTHDLPVIKHQACNCPLCYLLHQPSKPPKGCFVDSVSIHWTNYSNWPLGQHFLKTWITNQWQERTGQAWRREKKGKKRWKVPPNNRSSMIMIIPKISCISRKKLKMPIFFFNLRVDM